MMEDPEVLGAKWPAAAVHLEINWIENPLLR